MLEIGEEEMDELQEPYREEEVELPGVTEEEFEREGEDLEGEGITWS